MSQMIRRLGHAGFPLLLLAFSTGYTATGLMLGPLLVKGRLSPSFFPIVIGSLAIVLSLILTTRAWRATEPQGTDAQPTGLDRYRVMLIIVATALFIMVFQRVGYLFSAPTYVLSIILLFSDLRHIVTKILISIVTAMIAYFMFTQGFNVRLPGLWS